MKRRAMTIYIDVLQILQKIASPYRLLRLTLLLVLVIDVLVDRPFGFTWLRKLAGVAPPDLSSAPAPCGWDPEGTWKIGTVSSERPPWQWDATDRSSLLDATRKPAITCAHLGGNPATSFVADPFLIRNENLSSWFLFYELKNLARDIGELGVSESKDKGRTWKFRGTALAEPFHLSYPFIHFNKERRVYQMIPETNEANDVRIYETTEESFPFGWAVKHKPLTGVQFADTAAVWHRNRFWIYTTQLNDSPLTDIKWTLRLYHTKDLSDPWIEHPKSPILVKDNEIGRSAGRPIIHGDSIYRFAQDGTDFYGGGVSVLRVHVLTEELYEEQRVRFIAPEDIGAARFHHLDVHREEDGTWLAVYDFDPYLENHDFFDREGWLFCVKRIALVCLAVWSLWDILKDRLLRDMICRMLHDIGRSVPCDVGRRVRHVYDHILGFCIGAVEAYSSPTPPMSNARSKLLTVAKLGLIVACSFLFALASTDMKSQCIERDSLRTDQCFDRELANKKIATYATERGPPTPKLMLRQNEPRQKNGKDASFFLENDTEAFTVVTAASPAFMGRLRNFVGSVHYWEPNLEIEVYDLGLTDSDLDEIAQWRRVKVVPFQFEKYPSHVSLLYNIAWKIILLNEAIKHHPRMIFFDSGIEIRRPLTDVRYFLEKDGYFSQYLYTGTRVDLIGSSTHEGTYSGLKKIGVEFNADEVSRLPFCAGGVTGLARGHVESMLGPALECVLDVSCISPQGSGRNNHQYDQSVLSIVAHATGRGKSCHAENIVDYDPIGYTMDETRCNDALLGSRRWREPKPYGKHIDRHTERQLPPERKKKVLVFEENLRFRPDGEGKWVSCISDCDKKKENRDAWELCVKACPANPLGAKHTITFENVLSALMKLEAEIDYFWYRIRKGLHCRTIICRTFYFVLLSYSTMLLFSSSHRGRKNASPKNK